MQVFNAHISGSGQLTYGLTHDVSGNGTYWAIDALGVLTYGFVWGPSIWNFCAPPVPAIWVGCTCCVSCL